MVQEQTNLEVQFIKNVGLAFISSDWYIDPIYYTPRFTNIC